MFRLTNLTRVAAIGAIGAVVALAACESRKDVLGPHPLPTGEIFQSYVAIGNSITAGYQSGGINDSTQRQSYARLLAGQMGTQYHYASIAGRGCPPPIANGLTGARFGTGSTSTTCDLRTSSSVTDILNNVAVPGAISLDPTSSTTPASNILTMLVLGGKTQVQRALDARPTFATIWIGNNDVLLAATTGYIVPRIDTTVGIRSPGIVSTPAQLQVNYDAMMKQLLDNAPALKGVLIGVVQVSGVPLLSSGALIASNAQIQAGITAAAGRPVTINPNCTGSTALVNVPQLLGYIRAGAHPATIACAKNSDPLDPRVGDAYVLDSGELATLQTTVAGYNTYIQAKAAATGFAYYDPNVLLAARRATQEIPAFPNFQSTTATYGNLISLDGVHPAAAAHKLIANELIALINSKYTTTLPAVP
jgi:lysophospholipase L1-like esterase